MLDVQDDIFIVVCFIVYDRRRFLLLESQRLVRLLLIQLQFVKKELLVAMAALDDLFNANQVCGSYCMQ